MFGLGIQVNDVTVFSGKGGPGEKGLWSPECPSGHISAELPIGFLCITTCIT